MLDFIELVCEADGRMKLIFHYVFEFPCSSLIALFVFGNTAGVDNFIDRKNLNLDIDTLGQ